MRNGKSLGVLGAVWLAAVSTVALPGVALCGGSAAGDVLASGAPFLASMAVMTAMTSKRRSEAAVTSASLGTARA